MNKLTQPKLKICQWPKLERPREKLLHQSASALSNAELLALLFGSGSPGKSAVDLARELLHSYGDLHGLFQASWQQLSQHPGVGMAKFAQLQAVQELGRRYLQERLQQAPVTTHSQHLKHYLITHLGQHPQEVFAVVFLNSQYHILNMEKLFFGTIDHATIHPREVVQRTLQHNAAALVLAHNHPSGSLTPSAADCDITKHLQQALDLIDIPILDHIIVSQYQSLSMAELGMLA